LRALPVVVLGAFLTSLGLAERGGTGPAEATRDLEASLPVPPGGYFAVENLAGTLRVVPAPGQEVRVRAAVHAESEELAASATLARVAGKDGVPTLRVEYPLDRHREYRYPPRGPGRDNGIHFDGRRVSVSGDRGVLLYADLVVEVPASAAGGRLATRAGAIEAVRLEGRFTLDTGSGRIRVAHSRGDLEADTGSGDVEARDVHGSLRCDTGSGQCRVEGFEGEKLACDTGSGSVLVNGARAGSISLDTGSGQVRALGLEAEEVQVDTGSGSVEVEVVSERLRSLTVDTGSGNVRLRLPPAAGFEAKAELGSGRLVCDYSDAERDVRRHDVMSCRRGDRAIAIHVDSASGNVTIEPAR